MSATSMTQRASFATSSVSAARAMPKSASSRGALVVRGAASKAKKQGQLDALAAMANAEETFLVAGFNYQSLSVKDMITLRRSLPEGSHLMVAKNTLLRKAVAGTKFEPMAQATTGMNAWLFVDENVAPTMKAIKGLQKGWEKAGKQVGFNGACMDGQFLSPAAIAPLENLPTKLDLITQIAVGIKQVPTKLARGTKGNASKLGYAVQAISEGKSEIISA